MPHDLSNAARAEVLSQHRSNAYLLLIEIAHEDVSTIRLVGNTEDVVSNGNTYSATNLSLALPPEKDDELPTRQLILSNIDQTVLTALRTMSHQNAPRATVTGFQVRHTDPDTVERGPFDFELLRFTSGKGQVTLELAFQNLLSDNVVSYYVTPRSFPSAF